MNKHQQQYEDFREAVIRQDIPAMEKMVAENDCRMMVEAYVVDYSTDEKPLYIAAERGLEKSLAFLISQGAFINTYGENYSALRAAMLGDHVGCVRQLIEANAWVNDKKFIWDKTDLQVAREMPEDSEIRRLVVEAAPKFEAVLEAGNRFWPKVLDLLEAGAPIDMPDRMGDTVLLHILKDEKALIIDIEAVLRHKPGLHYETPFGHTPLFATQNPFRLQALFRAGASTLYHMRDGRQIIDAARTKHKDRPDLLNLFESQYQKHWARVQTSAAGQQVRGKLTLKCR